MISDELLMEYLDGHMDAARLRTVEQALSGDAGLQARLTELEANDRAVRLAFDALLDRPVPDQLEQMVRAAGARADRDPVRQARGLAERLRAAAGAVRDGWRGSPAWVGWALAAQAGLLVAATLFVGPLTAPRTADYHALGSAPEARPVNLAVMFRPDTSNGALREALTSADARIVDGPTEAGAYLVHVPDAERAAAIAKLKGRDDVLMAEPLDSNGARP